MAQAKRTNLLPSHYRILDSIQRDPDKALGAKELKELERDYRWDAPGVSDDPSMIDFFDTPRSTLFEGVVRVWNCAYLAALYSGVLKNPVTANIIDIGAGRGETLRVLKSVRLYKGSKINYTAIDIDIRKRELFCLLYPNNKSCYEIMDVRDGLDKPDNSADSIICTETLEHVTRLQGKELLAEAHRVLAPGGHLVLTTPNATLKRTAPSIYHSHEWQDEDLRAQVSEAGFDIVEWFYMGVSKASLGDLVPDGAERRLNTDLLRATLGPASGKSGNVIFFVAKKPEE